jgi:SIR2-like domain
MNQEAFLRHFVQNAPRLMWFLGAGISRTAGMPTAADITWDLKRRYYCIHENQTFQAHDINNKAVRAKIQAYMDGKGFPAPWSSEEYSFFFEQCFGKDYAAQQGYVADAVAPGKISLNIGHRVLAALLAMDRARIVFTTNFDEVVETAYATVTGKSLSAFHLEGAYAALDALNAEQFPIYAKIHGDFRYQSIKNLSADLVSNDQEIQRCFLAASSRYGLVVSGYSGRDANVRALFEKAIEQNNPFPHGLFWTTPKASEVSEAVHKLIALAQSKGIRAHIVETGTFDELLSRIWRQIPAKPNDLDAKVRSATRVPVSVPLPAPGTEFPLLRTNALPVLGIPTRCGRVQYAETIDFATLKERMQQNPCNATITFDGHVMFWGANSEMHRLLDAAKIVSIEDIEINAPEKWLAISTMAKAFFEEALCKSLCVGKPLLLRKKGATYFAVVNSDHAKDGIFAPLRDALAFKGKPGWIAGTVQNLGGATWSESVALRLEERDGQLWLLLRPDIWVSPLASRRDAIEFLKGRRRFRYNPQANAILDAWIRILLGAVGGRDAVTVSAYAGAEHAAAFNVGTRTAFSRRIGGHG